MLSCVVLCMCVCVCMCPSRWMSVCEAHSKAFTTAFNLRIDIILDHCNITFYFYYSNDYYFSQSNTCNCLCCLFMSSCENKSSWWTWIMCRYSMLSHNTCINCTFQSNTYFKLTFLTVLCCVHWTFVFSSVHLHCFIWGITSTIWSA